MSHVDDGLLHAYLDGELPASEAERLQAHIAECAECRGRLEEERALSRRAGELLALAEPPPRDVPPFRAGDLRPPVRVWWQVRFPLAWAATVVLALGMGWYLGGMKLGRPSATLARDSVAPSAPAGGALPLASEAKPAPRRAQAGRRTPVAPTQAKPSVENELAGALAQRFREDSLNISVAATPARQYEFPAAQALTVDSARALLGADPLALPDVPIESIRRIPTLGETVVVVQQPLDSSTTIELVHRRPVLLSVDAVVVSGAAEPRRERAETTRAAANPSPPAAKMLVRAPAPVAAGYAGRVTRFAGGVTVEIRGPLPADSLRKLLERAQPIP